MNRQKQSDVSSVCSQKPLPDGANPSAAASAPSPACYPGHWIGRFIWDRGESLPENAYLMFRKAFGLEAQPETARLHITAALKYRLWVNGDYVGYGPARSSPDWKSYDTYDLSGVLHQGRNAIAVLCWYTSVPNNYAADERAGLWAQVEYVDDAGHVRVIGTDPTWRLRPAKGYNREVAPYRGVAPEVYDARLDPADWQAADFDDSSWQTATCLVSGDYHGDPQMQASWTLLEPRQTPPMRERQIGAETVSYVGEADAAFYPDITNIVERMSGQDLFDLTHARAENTASLLGAGTGEAIFQSTEPSSPDAAGMNLLAGRTCHIVGPVESAAPPPGIEAFGKVPDQLACGDSVVASQQSVCDPNGAIDLAPFIGGAQDGRVAYVYVPFRIEEAGRWTVGVGADWWMECYLDGEKIADTTRHGNGFHPPHYSNFRSTVHLAEGEHLLAARVTSGELGCVFACGLISADKPGTAGRAPFVTLDFGRTYNAFPVIEFDAPAGAVIEITTGGKMSPDGRASWGIDPNWSRPAACMAAGGRQRWQVFEPRPVRFLQLVVRHASQPVKVSDVKLISWEYPADLRGSFACSDGILTKLWRAGVETAYLHMEDTLIFDVVRERAAWMCVGEVEQGSLALAAAYGDLPLIRWHLKQTHRSQLPSGLFELNQGSHAASNAGFPKPKTAYKVCNWLAMVNHMPFLVHLVRNRYWHWSDRAMLAEWYPALKHLAGWFVKRSDAHGLLYNLPGQIWFDWVSDNELRGANFESNAIYAAMLGYLGEIAAWLELPKEAEQWEQRAAKVRDALRTMHWNEARGLFCDSVIDGVQSTCVTELANGMALLYDIADDQQKSRIVRALSQKENGCTRVTILYVYYLVEGLIRAGAVDDALRLLSDRNREMVGISDPPTFWEEWPETVTTHRAGNSPLHFGGTGVVWSLSSQILGVQATAPGFKACRIEPECGGLTWAKGVVPTARGEVQVEWRKDAGKVVLAVVLPDDMPTQIRVPFKAGEARVLTHNGEAHVCRGAGGVGKGCTWDAHGVTVEVSGGAHRLEVSEGERDMPEASSCSRE